MKIKKKNDWVLVGHCNQGNMYLFPGSVVQLHLMKRRFDPTCSVGLGTLLSGSSIVSDGMLQAAAECLTFRCHASIAMLHSVENYSLAAYVNDDDVINGKVYPSISSIRDITKQVAAAVVKEAIEDDLTSGYREMDDRELKRLKKEEIEEYVQNNMWNPEYPHVDCYHLQSCPD